MSQTATATKPGGAVMSQRQILLVIIGLMAGMFLSALDQTVVSTSIRTIADDLNGLSQQAWVTTAYLVLSTISTPIYGKLSDIFGRRILFVTAIGIFIVGSLAASFSTSMEMLTVFRAVQGLGAGGLMSLALTIMGDILAPRERAKYQGYFLAVFGVSSVIGPLIGGLFAGANQILFISGWRWVFLLNVPIGIIALAIVLSFLHLPKGAHRSTRIDWWGAVAVIVGVGPLLLVASNGQTWGWGSSSAIVCYVIGAVGVIAFVLIQNAMKDDALIPLKLFRSATFSMASILGVLVGFAMFGALAAVPLFLQLVLGSTPTEAGLQMLPMILGLMISSIASGQIVSRTGKYRMFPIIGTAFLTLGFFWLTFLTADSSYWFLGGGMLIIGLGLGQLMQTLTLASQNSVGPKDIGVATSSSTFFRSIGGTAGTAVLFSVLFARVPDTIKGAFSDKKVVTDALNAALNPAVATASHNKGIMTKVYNPIVNPILDKLHLPHGGGIPDPTLRKQVVDSAVDQISKHSTGGSSSSLGTSLNGDTSFLTNASKALKEPFLMGFSNATITVFWVALVIAAIAFILTWFFRTPPLRQVSALQEVADDNLAAEKKAANDAALVESTADTGAAGASAAKRSDATAPGSPQTGSINVALE